MAFEDITDQYITYEARLASFQKTSKKRGSTANGRGAKALNWPHKHIAPASLARAGLFFYPSPENPDNVVCFLCHKGLDGWEEGDDPLVEHLTHSPNCGWAIVAAIEAEYDGLAKEDPSQTYMKDARKATFAGRWPHEGKKGWKCKTKQLVDAGWKYTPTSDSDDMATCVYCQLALDGWEPGDKPLDEHFNRSPDCAFFALLDEAQTTKKSRAKAGRASKASRLSVQSVATAASEVPSVSELEAGPEDSIMTTSSTLTVTGKKGKAKKATAKGRKTKAKKEEPAEVVEIEDSIQEEAAPAPKSKRGKKRDSAAMEESTMTISEAPAPKKRATRTRGSTAVDSSLVHPDDSEMSDAPAPKKAAAKKKGKAKTTRKTSTTSVASAFSTASSVPGAFPDNDEIERQLEADLQRPLSDDDEITLDHDSERMKAQSKKALGAIQKSSADYAMFNPAPVDPDDAEVEDELAALQAEMEMEEPATVPQPKYSHEHDPEPEVEQELHVPKKGRKAGTARKASKQTKSKKTKAAPVPEEEVHPETEDELMSAPVEPQAEEPALNESIASTDTVVKKTAASRPSNEKRKRGRPSKASLQSQEPSEVIDLVEAPAQQPVKRGRGRPSKVSLASQASEPEETKIAEPAAKRGRGRPKKSVEVQKTAEPEVEDEVEDMPELVGQVDEEVDVYEGEASGTPERHAPVVSFDEAPRSPEVHDDASPQLPSSSRHLAEPPSTPGRIISPAPSARQAAISPSQSPQSSNAENEPPSSMPATSTTKRVALAPVAATPTRGSPSKRNILAGLKSATPWTAVDVDAVFCSPGASPNKENASTQRFLAQGNALTSPEKHMTVEEWIYHNASEAERKLKHECEAMVSRFESEGSKAMRVLEGMIVE